METNKREAGKGKSLVRNQEGIVLMKQRNLEVKRLNVVPAQTTDESETER